MATENIVIKSADGLEFDAYVSRPDNDNRPVIIVIQEIFGINKWLRSFSDFIAQQGFIAVAPDLFHRQERGIQLTDQTDAEWKRAMELYQGFDVDKGVEDLIATVKAARTLKGANGKVGSIGFCLGGKLAYLMSARSDSDADVGYYGVGIEKNLNETPKHPLLLHIAAKDPYSPPEAVEEITSALSKTGKVTIHIYPDQDHAFCRVGGQHYDKQAAEQAHERTVEFFSSHLG